MNQATEVLITGAAIGGGFYAGRIRIGEQVFALIVSPKAEGEHEDAPWNKSTKNVEGAMSYFDGRANTEAMAKAGSKLAKWALDLRIGEYDDWYLPSQDELEVIYRNLKPGTEENYCYARSGINLSSTPPQYPYTPAAPGQTECEAFRRGGSEAFDEVWYLTSTQHASDSSLAWGQLFADGYQGYDRKGNSYRARAVRRLPI